MAQSLKKSSVEKLNNNYIYDRVLCILSKYIFPLAKQDEKESYINIITQSECNEQFKAAAKILREIGISYNAITNNSDIRSIKKIINGAATISLDEEYGSYLAEVINVNYKVPYIKTNMPIGINGTSKWIFDIAAELGLEDKADKYIFKSLKSIEQLIVYSSIMGKRVYINQGPIEAIQLANLVQEFNGEVAGISVDNSENLTSEELEGFYRIFGDEKLNFSTSQIFKVIDIVKNSNPDVYIGKQWDSNWISKSGIKTIATDNESLYGFQGVEKILKQFSDTFRNERIETYFKKGLAFY